MLDVILPVEEIVSHLRDRSQAIAGVEPGRKDFGAFVVEAGGNDRNLRGTHFPGRDLMKRGGGNCRELGVGDSRLCGTEPQCREMAPERVLGREPASVGLLEL